MLSATMARIQIRLQPELHRLAKERARELGVSFAEYIRRLVTHDLDRPKTRVGLSCVFNLGSGGRTNIARHKDRMIGEAFWADHRRSHGRP